MSDFQKWQEKKLVKKKEKKIEAKQKKLEQKAQGRMNEQELIEEQKKKAQLELLVRKSEPKSDQKQLGTNDSRFNTGDKDFAVDPTHREFRKVVLGHNKVSKRQRHF